MKIFDWIPTIDEVFDFVDCRIAGHSWIIVTENGEQKIRCKVCGKLK